MVRAILDGRKTQTRCVVRLPKKFAEEKGYPRQPLDILPIPNSKAPNGREWVTLMTRDPHHGCMITPGRFQRDHLWVRETWAHDDPDCKDIKCGNIDHIWWRANEAPIVAESFAGDAHWRSPIHMQRWTSRINLEIIKIHVERLLSITEEDAIAEGAPLGRIIGQGRAGLQSHREGFIELWDSLNFKRGYGSDQNPWVWVIEFKRLNNMLDAQVRRKEEK